VSTVRLCPPLEANPAAVQRILHRSDPRRTTDCAPSRNRTCVPRTTRVRRRPLRDEGILRSLVARDQLLEVGFDSRPGRLHQHLRHSRVVYVGEVDERAESESNILTRALSIPGAHQIADAHSAAGEDCVKVNAIAFHRALTDRRSFVAPLSRSSPKGRRQLSVHQASRRRQHAQLGKMGYVPGVVPSEIAASPNRTWRWGTPAGRASWASSPSPA
jgi:hypothetical protein